jgi:hypothetical protein
LASSRLVSHTRRPALHEHGLPGLHAGAHEQHSVGGQPGGRQARRLLEGESRRLGHEVAARHRDALGQRARVQLGQQRALGVERLVARPAIAGDDRVDHHLVSVLVHAGRVAAEDHRQPVLGQADAAQRPQVVVVERRRPHVDHRPPVRRLGLRAFADLERGQRVVGILAGGVGGEHA